jgi:hypothetical protein
LVLEAEIKGLEQLSKITLPIVCPCDKGIVTDVPINLQGDNEYICRGCDKKAVVLIQTKSALVTEPMNTTSLDDPEFVRKIEKLMKENKNDLP